MSKASANRVDAGSPAAHELRAPSPIKDWLQRAMADLAVRSTNDKAPVELTQSLAAMAALLRVASRAKDGPGGGAHGARGGGVNETDVAPASVGAPAGATGACGPAAGESLTDLPRLLNQVEARLRAGGRVPARGERERKLFGARPSRRRRGPWVSRRADAFLIEFDAPAARRSLRDRAGGRGEREPRSQRHDAGARDKDRVPVLRRVGAIDRPRARAA